MINRATVRGVVGVGVGRVQKWKNRYEFFILLRTTFRPIHPSGCLSTFSVCVLFVCLLALRVLLVRHWWSLVESMVLTGLP